MTDFLDELNNKNILTKKEVELIRNRIHNRYVNTSDRRQAQLVADNIYRLLEKNLEQFSLEVRKRIIRSLVMELAGSSREVLNCKDVFDVCMDFEQIEEDFFIDQLRSWVNKNVEAPVSLYGFMSVVEKERKLLTSDNRTSSHANDEEYEFEYSNDLPLILVQEENNIMPANVKIVNLDPADPVDTITNKTNKKNEFNKKTSNNSITTISVPYDSLEVKDLTTPRSIHWNDLNPVVNSSEATVIKSASVDTPFLKKKERVGFFAGKWIKAASLGLVIMLAVFVGAAITFRSGGAISGMVANTNESNKIDAITPVYSDNELNALAEERGKAKRIPVLLYHSVCDYSGSDEERKKATVSKKLFEEHIKYLKENGFVSVTARQLCRFAQGKQDLPEKAILITFDDGYKDNFINAYPILKEYGFTALVFVITDSIPYEAETYNEDSKILQKISWEEMHLSGDVFEYGSHTHRMHYFDNKGKSGITLNKREQILKDLLLSKQMLETNYFSYPFGQYYIKTIDLVKKVGYTAAFKSNGGSVEKGDDLLQLNRISVRGDLTVNEYSELLFDAIVQH